MVRKGRKNGPRGRKFIERDRKSGKSKSTAKCRKRKADKSEPHTSKKMKQTVDNNTNLDKSEYLNNLDYEFSDQSDENEDINELKSLRENLDAEKLDESSDDESDGNEVNQDSHKLDPKSSTVVDSNILSPADRNSSASESEENTDHDAFEDSSEEINMKIPNQKSSMSQDPVDSDHIGEESNTEDSNDSSDPFVKHLLCEIPSDLLSAINAHPKIEDRFTENWPNLGKLLIKIPVHCNSENFKTSLENDIIYTEGGNIPKICDLKHLNNNMHIKSQILTNLNFQKNNLSIKDEKPVENAFLTPFQNELFSIINNYQDLFYTKRSFKNGEDIRFVYCLHLINHVLKTRTKILHHNAKITDPDDISVEYRDQGLVRPKILVLVPFMDSAYKIVSLLERILLPINKGNVMNKKKFLEEYTGQEMVMPFKNKKPEDYELTFVGNIFDDFKIGISITKKSLKLYADFYNSDIIIASPLGLRRIIGAKGEDNRDYDFLASIEVLILDQAEIFLMQNFNHLTHIFEHLHLQPKESHGVDFSRVRLWSLSGKAKFYRQTLIFSSFDTPELSCIFNRDCANYAGSIKNELIVENGSMSKVVVQVPHRFHKFSATGVEDSISKRFDFFVKYVLPSFKDILLKQVMIFIPDYYDFVKLRNYFRKEVISFVQICEYTKPPKVARARDMFYHGDAQFILYTERFHFYNRIKLKGIRHIVFYQPPYSPHFYSEMCNLMQDNYLNKRKGCNLNMSVSVIYSKYDIYQLGAICGTDRAHKMIKSDRHTHMIVTGE